ncbi:RNA polymerase sigma-70 factor [Persicobacter diffluens]|uniref:DNA-directed RNA polymerase sigma-70 factor n=1 Tax=Persicobacter diffluens TaxID=981 RepID=A0AAN5APQ7_9BACT|nr:DNA-directed RNA polymerase sigma-70 factor [Persicobacter diffluens]
MAQLLPESELVLNLKNGDSKAFDRLFAIYNKQVYYFALSYVKNASKAENLLQDIFLKVWKNRAQLDPEKNFKSFLFTMTKNLILDGFKKESSERKYQEFASYKNMKESTTYNDVVMSELQDLLKDIEEEMPAKRKSIYKMSRYEHLNNREISQKLEISEKTVENQITLSLKHIKNRLKDLYNLPKHKLQ